MTAGLGVDWVEQSLPRACETLGSSLALGSGCNPALLKAIVIARIGNLVWKTVNLFRSVAKGAQIM